MNNDFLIIDKLISKKIIGKLIKNVHVKRPLLTKHSTKILSWLIQFIIENEKDEEDNYVSLEMLQIQSSFPYTPPFSKFLSV